ncbi:MAG: branched-chain amino acid ABC transporter permease [Beijerinckiaceae bacterium]
MQAITILLDGLAYGMVLFIISVGLTVTMGLMRVVNLAHGAFAMMGGYVSVGITKWLLGFAGGDNASGSAEIWAFVGGVVFATAIVSLLGAICEFTIFRPLYRKGELAQVLMTIGMVFVAVAAMSFIYGPKPYPAPLPTALDELVSIGYRQYPLYRLFLIAVGAIMAVGLWLLIEHSLFGARLRAAVDDPEMARSLGINVNLLFTLTFVGGCALAAFGGAVGIGFLPLDPEYAQRNLVYFHVVVAVGGMGSFRGSLVAALAIGIIQTIGTYLLPEVGSFLLWFLVFALLLWRPHGLIPPKNVS